MANVIITIETSVKSIVILVAEYPRQQKPKVCRQLVVEVPYKNINTYQYLSICIQNSVFQ